MEISGTAGALKQFRRTAWRFEQTFHTPLKKLPPFVAVILSALGPIETGSLTIDRVVFDPRKLIELLGKSSIEIELTHNLTLVAAGEVESRELLQAALSESVDFLLVPTPKRFVIYADHDEYTTFLSMTKSHLNRVAKALVEHGFRRAEGYKRRS